MLSPVSSPLRAEPAVPITPDYIRKIRKSLALTQAKFGERLGVSASTVSAWERGKSKPQPAPASSENLRDNVLRIAHICRTLSIVIPYSYT